MQNLPCGAARSLNESPNLPIATIMKTCPPVRFRNFCLVSALLALAAACSTVEKAPPSSNPHYKVGSPYKVDGRWYTPAVDEDYDEIGLASWYGDQFDGKLTANGEIFDKTRLTAAHKTLPMPSLVQVDNLENGRSITLRLNDRGPFVDDRIIDLSEAAAVSLGFQGQGLAKVRVRYLGEAELTAIAPKTQPTTNNQARAPRDTPRPLPRLVPEPSPAPTSSDELDPIAALLVRTEAAPKTPQPIIRSNVAAAPDTAVPDKVNRHGDLFVRIGNFYDAQIAETAASSLAAFGNTEVLRNVDEIGEVLTIYLGPFDNRNLAEAKFQSVLDAGYSHATLATQKP